MTNPLIFVLMMIHDATVVLQRDGLLPRFVDEWLRREQQHMRQLEWLRQTAAPLEEPSTRAVTTPSRARKQARALQGGVHLGQVAQRVGGRRVRRGGGRPRARVDREAPHGEHGLPERDLVVVAAAVGPPRGQHSLRPFFVSEDEHTRVHHDWLFEVGDAHQISRRRQSKDFLGHQLEVDDGGIAVNIYSTCQLRLKLEQREQAE
mmetsp:Transcript_44578/g.97080  ORF Transcript_44578/g.97080 Transcript_44578/m.97080 type:complete len:205 (+) Transcript_44578:2-616(+)